MACPRKLNNDGLFLNLNRLLDCLWEDMDNGLFILFAPERATSALHTLSTPTWYK